MAMISLGGVIGTGLFVGTGGALSNGGPLGLFMGYALMGSVCLSVMVSLGELVALFPVAGGHIKLASECAVYRHIFSAPVPIHRDGHTTPHNNRLALR
jgi:amino acid permease